MSFLAWRDIAVRYKQTAIGVAWALIRPALTLLVFVAFRRMAGLQQGTVPDVMLVLAAVLPWQFFSSALLGVVEQPDRQHQPDLEGLFPAPDHSDRRGGDRVCRFPRSRWCCCAVLMLWYGVAPGCAARWRCRCSSLLAAALSLGLGLLLAALTVKYRDFRYVVPFIVQLGLFVSPVAFATSQVPERWRALYALNPMVGIIDGFRWAILGGSRRSIRQVAGLGRARDASSLLVSGVWYFRRTERGFADVI